jgi:hypothetical protein
MICSKEKGGEENEVLTLAFFDKKKWINKTGK